MIQLASDTSRAAGPLGSAMYLLGLSLPRTRGPRRNLAGNTHTLQHVVVLMGNVNFGGLKTSQLFLYVSFLVDLHLA